MHPGDADPADAARAITALDLPAAKLDDPTRKRKLQEHNHSLAVQQCRVGRALVWLAGSDSEFQMFVR